MARDKSSSARLVLFDVGGVLVRWRDEWTFRELSRMLHIPYPRVLEVMLPLREALQSGQIPPRVFWDRAGASFKRKMGPRVRAVWVGNLRKHARLNRSAFALAHDLRSSGYATGVFSNTDPSHAALFRREGWFADFHPWVLSYEAHATKPDRSAYEWAEKRTGRSPRDLVLVDDRPTNVWAARRRGWQAVRYVREEEVRRSLHRILPGFDP